MNLLQRIERSFLAMLLVPFYWLENKERQRKREERLKRFRNRTEKA